MDEPRILTDDETYQRRAERASHQGPKTIELCQWKGCDWPAFNGPFCTTHRCPETDPGFLVVEHLSQEQLADLRVQVEADAAPLFVLAMSWIARQQLVDMGVTLDSLETSMHRIRGELEGTGP